MLLFLLTDKYLLSLSRWNEIDGEPENWAAIEYCRRHEATPEGASHG